MRFDPISFALGVLSASGVSFLLWRSRRRISTIQESAETQIEGTRRYIGQAADARYRRDMLRYLQQRHVAAGVFDLTEMLIEPRLIPAPPPASPPSEDRAIESIFEIVPVFHDFPQSYAPFNVESISLADLGAGDRHVAILGISGLGKSVALTTLALMAFGEVSFETLEDLTERAIREEEEGLSEDERKERAKERQRMQDAALTKLHDAREKERQQLGRTAQAEQLPRLSIPGLLPLLVHVSDLEFDVVAYGRGESLDPAEPLARAAQRYVSPVTARVVGSALYPALEKGQALILLDGYDELSPAARETYYYWLGQLLAAYGNNMIVIAGPAEGYEPLIKAGFTPAFLRAWRSDDYNQLAKRWSAAWTKRQGVMPDEQAMRRIRADNRGRTMLDVTLKIWTGLADDAQRTGRPGWYDALIRRQLSMPDARDRLPALAEALLKAGQPLARAALVEALAPAGDEDQKAASKAAEILDALAKDGVLVGFAGDRLSFSHPQIANFLASEILADAGGEQASELALDPAWEGAFPFAAAQLSNMVPVIYRKLSVTTDLLYSDLFGIARWLPDAPTDAPWRGDVFKRLAAALLAPQQYPMVRARALAALIASRDRNVLFILRQALRVNDPYTRQLACIGLGALGDPEAINDLNAMISSEERQVQLAAGLALGAIGTDEALQVMADGLLNGAPDLRRAIAEALAALPGEGHDFLRESIRDADIEVRRAAVYGLSRVQTPWALAALYRAMIEDEQWYVRSAAEDAFMMAQSPEGDGPRAHPEADSLPWLVVWAADRGEGVPAGENARQVLVRALQEGQSVHKVVAAHTLGRLGHVSSIKPLYAALRDRDPDVRGAAYEALADIQTLVGQRLPGVN